MQLLLDALKLAPEPPATDEPPAPEMPDLLAQDLVVIAYSTGKDSMAMLAYVIRQLRAAGYTGRIAIVHNKLGVTDSGEDVEWPGVEELGREHAAKYGIPFYAVSREKGGLIQQLLRERRRWMGERTRWCTADQKTLQGMKLVTRLVRDIREELGITDRPVRVLYCLGLRAEESSGRKKQKPIEVDKARSNRTRTITRWLPIHKFTVKQVWDEIKAEGMRPHAAYSWGMTRLSCSLCILASVDDLMLAGALRPRLLDDYLRAEIEIGHRFTFALSISQIRASLDAVRMELDGRADDAADEIAFLRKATREIVQEQNDLRTGTYVRTGLPKRWSDEQVAERTDVRVDQLLTSARRAITLAA